VNKLVQALCAFRSKTQFALFFFVSLAGGYFGYLANKIYRCVFLARKQDLLTIKQV
jgi:hypothetical protein